VQKRAIPIARENPKPGIVATQKLGSMINN
jgi:pyruvate kinase